MSQSAIEIQREVAAGRRTAASVLEECLRAIDRLNPALNAFLSVEPEYARRKAAEIDAQIAAGRPPGPLAGVPIALKDNICTRWGTTTCASRILAEYRSPFDAHVVERLEQAGAIIVGKTNLDEFAMGSSTENSAHGPTRNPWNTRCVPGGSSGGSAAAVAAGLVPLALGSETGGSVRQPAAFCNVVGLKPSYGRVSRYGLVAFGSSLDQIGAFGRSVDDVALLLGVIAGRDPRDSTSVDAEVPDYLGDVHSSGDRRPAPHPASPKSPPGRPHSWRVGLASEYMGEGLDPEVRAAVEAAVDVYRAMGAEVVPVSLPHLPYAIACYYLICTAEASSNLARFDGVRYGHRAAGAADIHEVYSVSRAEGFGPEVKRRIMLGTYALSSGYYDAYYLKALKVRTLIRRDFEQVFEQVDVLLSPTSPVAAFAIGERADDPLAMYLADIYTAAANLAGICAISIPCGFTADQRPIGLQLQAAPFAETALLRAAFDYQAATGWHRRTPEL